MTTSTAPAAWAGVVAVIEVLLTTVTPVAAVPPKVTPFATPEFAPIRFVPVMVTAVPPAVVPEAVEMLVNVGAGAVTLMNVIWVDRFEAAEFVAFNTML